VTRTRIGKQRPRDTKFFSLESKIFEASVILKTICGLTKSHLSKEKQWMRRTSRNQGLRDEVGGEVRGTNWSANRKR
jgi:hypothetical protein